MMVPRNSTPSRQRGLTLIEQIMVLAIMAVLMSVATPSMRRLVSRNEVRTAQSDFIAALRHARETAVMSGKRTLFCPSSDGAGCDDTAHWEGGWLLGPDVNHDDQPDNGPLRVGHGYNGKLSIHGSTGRHLVRFYPDGSASGSNLTLLFCQPSSADHVLSVVVANSGRIRGAPASALQAEKCLTRN